MKKRFFTIFLVALSSLLFFGLAGCLRQVGPVLRWSDFLTALTHTDSLARLDTPQSHIITSFDPKGGNDDYNNFVRKGPEGWVVLADLKGPGVLTRFWFTGADDGTKKFRFYVDRSWRPSFELTLDEMTGGKEPFTYPFAAYENYCWYSMIPIPYRKRLIIMTREGATREGGWPRLFYQINYTKLPRTQRVQSFDCTVTDQDRAAMAKVKKAWSDFNRAENSPAAQLTVGMMSLKPGEKKWTMPIKGPGIIRELKITPRFDKIPSVINRESVLRDIVLRIQWNESGKNSVVVPLGDFFGSVWHRTRYQSMFFGLTNDTFSCRFPMPFEKLADIQLENQGIMPVELDTEVIWEPLPEWDKNWGYFHAAWSGTTPRDAGKPHPILRASGKGKYVGCVLGVLTLDKSWWILEGDEKMYIDKQTTPYWHGTGLEDYFNGGWYYQNPLARPLHGMVFKVPFRIVQYRLHLADSVNFDSGFSMMFERGPDNASHGWMESVAYYYLDEPKSASFRLKSVGQRQPPQDPLAQATIMSELFNYERLGDYRGARDCIDLYLELFPSFPFEAILRLRKIAYMEEIEGFDSAWPLYQKFITEESNEAAIDQAKLLAWFHEDEENALMSLYGSGRTRGLLDGKELVSVTKPDKTGIAGVKIKPGAHCLATESPWQGYPSWVQTCLKTHKGMVMTGTNWTYAFNPKGDWGHAGYDDSSWKSVGRGGTTKGPPEEPYIWVEPNAFVGMQSKPAGLRPKDEAWPNKNSTVVYRHPFAMPK